MANVGATSPCIGYVQCGIQKQQLLFGRLWDEARPFTMKGCRLGGLIVVISAC